MAKQIINFSPAFVPGPANVGYLDFSGMDPEFNVHDLYAVINVTRNVIMYAPGAAGLGGSTTSTNFGTTSSFPAQTPYVLTLSLDTSTFSDTDILNVIYDVPAGTQGPNGSNEPMERSGMLERQVKLMTLLLLEMRVQNEILMEGLLMGRAGGISRESTDDYRNELSLPAQWAAGISF